MKTVTPWKTKMNQGEGHEYWGSTFQARVEGPEASPIRKYHCGYVQKAPDDIRWTIDRPEFDELIAFKKESALTEFRMALIELREALGSQFLFQRLTNFCWKEVPSLNTLLKVRLDFLQPAQCAYADDLAVAASSFRCSMTAPAPAFHSVNHIAGLNLNCRKCCWVQYGTEGRESLWHWLSEKCEEFREMQIVRYAKYVGTMIGPDGYIHRWTAPRKRFIQRVLKINASTKSLLSDCATSRSMRYQC